MNTFNCNKDQFLVEFVIGPFVLQIMGMVNPRLVSNQTVWQCCVKCATVSVAIFDKKGKNVTASVLSISEDYWDNVDAKDVAEIFRTLLKKVED